MNPIRVSSGRPGTCRRVSAGGMVLLWGILLLGIAVPPARAQSLGLVPAQFQYTFQPGKPFQFDLAVSNNGPEAVLMTVSVTDLWYNDKNEKVFDPPGRSP